MYSVKQILIAFALTAAAGLSTGIGSFIALFSKQKNTKFLAVTLGFSAGVMIYVSFAELFAKSIALLSSQLGKMPGTALAAGAFFGGMLLIAVIDGLIPGKSNPYEMQGVVIMGAGKAAYKQKRLLRSGMLTALAIAVHNFPEGMATFVSALQEASVAVPIVIAIACHNIPEGLAVAAPIFYATNNKKRAFILSFLSGLAEPLGALVGFLILMPFLGDTVFGVLFAVVAGIMVFISLDELLPSAHTYGEHRLSICGLVLGMLTMAVSLILFL